MSWEGIRELVGHIPQPGTYHDHLSAKVDERHALRYAKDSDNACLGQGNGRDSDEIRSQCLHSVLLGGFSDKSVSVANE